MRLHEHSAHQFHAITTFDLRNKFTILVVELFSKMKKLSSLNRITGTIANRESRKHHSPKTSNVKNYNTNKKKLFMRDEAQKKSEKN